MLAKSRINAFLELAKSNSKDKILVPYETAELIGTLSILKEFLLKYQKEEE